MQELVFKITIWLLLWLLTWVIYYLLSNRKMDYSVNWKKTSVFFFVFSILQIAVFYKDLGIAIGRGSLAGPILVFVIVFAAAMLIYKNIKILIPYYKNAFEDDGTIHFAKFDFRYLCSKSFEILYQQIAVALLCSWLYKSNLNILYIIILFAIFFSLGHLPLLFYAKKRVALYFFVSAWAGSIVFPILILDVDWGIIYSYSSHWCFYIFSGLLFAARSKNSIIK